MEIFLSAIVFVTMLHQGMAACTYASGRTEKTAFGRTRHFCDFIVTSNGSSATLVFELGSKFTTADCLQCECTADGMRCCGIGIKSGERIYTPPGCHVVADGCTAVVVSKADNRTACYRPNARRRLQRPMFPPFNPFAQFLGPMGGLGGRRGQQQAEMDGDGLMSMMLIPFLMNSGDPGIDGGQGPQGGNAMMGPFSPLMRNMMLLGMLNS